MSSPAEIVTEKFELAKDYSDAAEAKLAVFTDRLANGITGAPTVSVQWQTLDMPTLPVMPSAPTMPVVVFNESLLSQTPGLVSESLPNLDIDDFTERMDDLNLPARPVLPDRGNAPAIPSVGEVAVPDAPALVDVERPTMLALSTVTFGGVDLREGWLDRLESMPELELLQPTPFTYNRGSEYASELLTELKALLARRMQGGTGLSPEVEAAIFGRARDRETVIALGNQAEILRQSEAAGFPLPTGMLAHQLRQSTRDYHGKLSELSRDVAIKQAELEQQNLRDAITAGMQLEGQLITYALQLEQMTFEAAKTAAQNAIDLHNAAITHFKALLEGYQAYASVYKTIIEGQLAKVEVFKAQLAAEQSKADINKALVDQYKAEIEAGMAQVEIYRARVGAAQTLVALEQAKISAGAEQVRAFVAQINADTAIVEMYKANVQAESLKVDVHKTRAEVYSVRVNAQAEKARAATARFTAIQAANAQAWDGYKARIGAESARLDAVGRQSTALLEGYRAETHAVQAQAELTTKVWEANMKQYEAGWHVTLQTAKINADNLIATRQANLDAAKAGTQAYAQLLASSYGMVSASAQISGGSTLGVNYSYGGDVAGTVSPLPVPPG